jgi:steroid 5-alpha reductase family enzyme
MADVPYRIGRGWAGLSRPKALAVVTVAYVGAALAGWAVAAALEAQHPIMALFWADIVATVVVFAFSMAVGNSSLYDPYWSVAPPLIALAWMMPITSPRQIVLLVLMMAWAIRLTANWAVGWSGLAQEDWRYIQIRNDTKGRLPWWLTSFTGIQLVPTLFVFAGMLPVWPAVADRSRAFGLIDVLAIVVTGGAIVVEALSDLQLHRFTSDPANRGKTVDIGLWRHSRHPNYLGEISFWWGLWLFAIAAAPSWWWTVIGPIAITALFLGVSIPLMERRSVRRRPAYAEYQRTVPVLIPWRFWAK